MSLGGAGALVLAYLIGSIDFAVVVARVRRKNIYELGSGNPGASNVLRSMGKTAGALVLAGDLGKGLLAAWLGATLGGNEAVGFAAGLLAVAGHCYPVFHRFRGGKGAATFGGALLYLTPWAWLIMAAVFTGVVVATKIASLGSLAGAVLAMPLGYWLDGVRGWPLVWLAATVVLVLYRHRGNIVRLVRGAERKVVEE